MTFITYLFSTAAGPATAVAEWAADFHVAVTSLLGHNSFELVTNDADIKNPPPGEAYATLRGNREDADDQLLYMLPSLFFRMAERHPDLAFYFNAEQGVSQGVRGLIKHGRCVVLDFYGIEANSREQFALVDLDRQIAPTPEKPIPEYYASCFHMAVLPDTQPGAFEPEAAQNDVEARYIIQLRDSTFGRWIEQEIHGNVHDAREEARGYSNHCDARSRIVDHATGEVIEVWNEGQREEKKGELQ